MKAAVIFHTSDKGFTLLEVIVSLIILSIFGAAFVSFFQTRIASSTQPVIAVQQGFSLDEIMEKIKAEYELLINADPTPLITLQANIQATPSSYGEYTAITKFINFDGSGNEEAAECSANCSHLKVSITVGDQNLTTVFSK
ncbi:MAG: type II secretion system GspH family protein [Proteobacteria bacterium]|nr:type II secretion system GspH family protein [Pseudomonadota bacterium]MBU1389550.1 type II secretion system GspH family protein [Pseudomonadota bacterium]MBU1544414.1 type II secretion system GspH family protein [Pseudomonadota bacterium]MBU2430517.1 type II secretion system GspH family protein [Pseudomonadota bacterium]MBU2480688.1 type II secretion system GspH family protein [Pseudomonadota bacterium]